MTVPHIPSADEIGHLMLRLTIADPEFLLYVTRRSTTLENLGEKMLPSDKETLRAWCGSVWFQREILRISGVLKDDGPQGKQQEAATRYFDKCPRSSMRTRAKPECKKGTPFKALPRGRVADKLRLK